MGRACSTYGERRGAYRVLVEKAGGRKLLGKPRHRREGNIKMDFREVGWGAWTGSIWLRTGMVVGCCKCGNEPSGFIKCGEFID